MVSLAMKAGHNTDDHITQYACESTECTYMYFIIMFVCPGNFGKH